MKAILSKAIIGIAALSQVLAVEAQTFEERTTQNRQSLSSAQMEKLYKDYQVSNPLLRGMFISPRHSKDAVVGVRQNGSAPVSQRIETATGTTIWGNIMYLDDWSYMEKMPYGYYSFEPVSSPQFNLLYQQERNYANNGVAYVDGHLYQLSMDDKFKSIDICSEVLYDFDTSTWTRHNDTIANKASDLRYDLMALETAEGPDGTVYGQFYSADQSRLEWGTIDYKTLTRTTFGQCSRTYVALGVTKQHQLYGVAADGNLYQISTTDGTEKLVGPTGLTVTANGSYYYQSGEIDPSDNTFYWAAVLPNGDEMSTGLYTVDLNTGAATKVGNYTGQILGLVIPHDVANDGAPEAVSDLAVDFTAPSLTGTVSFTVPSKTFDGGNLSGQVSYTVTANSETVASGTANAGTKVNESVTLPRSGEYTFVVTASTTAGESPKASASQFVGYDIPDAPSAVSATVDGGNVTVSWQPSTKGANNGYIGNVTYDVSRVNGIQKDTVAIAEGTSATSVADQLPADADLGYYYYIVTAHNGDQTSATVASNGFTYGDALTPDWQTSFNDASDFGLFRIVDANKDGRTWRYYASDGAAMSNYNSANGNDDWLFTPGFRLEKNYTYIFKYKVRNVYAGYPNSLEVKWGSDTTAAAMKTTLLPTTTPSGEWTDYSHEVAPTESGVYYFGFHDNTADHDQYAVELDDVAIVKSSAFTAPDSVTNFNVVPGEQGALEAKVTFNLPKKNVQGDPINGKVITKVVVERDGEVFKSYPKPGKTTTYAAGSKFDAGTDKGMASGWHTYTVTCSNKDGVGRTATKKVYIGIDAPDVPTGLRLTDDTTAIKASWNAFPKTGVNGAYLDSADVAVSFFDHYENYYGQQAVGDSVTSSKKGELSMRLPQNPETSINRGAQGLYYLAARADGSMGKSGYVFTPSIVVGPSIVLPFSESFISGSTDNHFIWVEGNEQYRNRADAAGWTMETSGDADNNGGAVFWKEYSESSYYGTTTYTIKAGDEASVNMPKVALSTATNPMLLFQLYATKGEQAQLKVIIQTPDGVDHDGKLIDLAQTASDGWTRQSLSLKDYAGQRYVIVKFRGISGGDDTNIGIDDIRIYDQPAYNLAVTAFTAPESADAGAKAKFAVGVRNTGSNAISNYKVTLYANGSAADSTVVSEPLASLAENSVELGYWIPAGATDTIDVYAVVSNDLDPDNSDNMTSTERVAIRQSGYPTVSDLAAGGTATSVKLTWSDPVFPEPQTVTEDFESYAPFATSLGDWTTVDGDKGRAAAIFSSNPIPVYGKAFAFTAFNPNAITSDVNVLENAPGLTPHSGDQFAASVFSYGNGDVIDADNWLISPVLSGNAQTVKFYVFNVAVQDGMTPVPYTENFDVLYSTTDADTASFKKIESDVADGTNLRNVAPNWKEVSVEIPEDANYFAIHQNTGANSTYIFGVDDVTFEKGTPGQNDDIAEFRIYRDGELIGSCDGNTFEYTDASGSEDAVYNVTVVYQDKQGNRHESALSNSVSLGSATVIAAITANGSGSYDVYTIDGKTVGLGLTDLKRLPRGLYVVNGVKCVIK